MVATVLLPVLHHPVAFRYRPAEQFIYARKGVISMVSACQGIKGEQYQWQREYVLI